MAMNIKGQAALVGLIVGVFLFMFGMIVIDPMRDVIDESRSVTQLDCDNSSISDGTKATCLAVDLVMPYFILIIFATAGAWISARLIG